MCSQVTPEYVYLYRIIQRLAEEMKVSKNTWAHAKLAYYLYLILSVYPQDGVMDRYHQYIENYMQQSLTDANPEARSNGRNAFLVWQ